MVKARGGPNSIPSFLMDSVFLTDLHMATMNHRPPSYPLLDVHKPSLQTLLPEACHAFGLAPHPNTTLRLSDKFSERLDRNLAATLVQLQDLIDYTNAFDNTSGKLPVDLRKLYVSKTFAVEHSILSRIQPHEADVEQEIQEVCINAVLLFLKTCIQKWSSYSPLVRIIVRRLQSTLSFSQQDTLFELDSNFLLWCLFIGTYASSGQTTEPWFLAMIRMTASRLRLRSWTDIYRSLINCYYIDSLFEEPFSKIWIEANDGNIIPHPYPDELITLREKE